MIIEHNTIETHTKHITLWWLLLFLFSNPNQEHTFLLVIVVVLLFGSWFYYHRRVRALTRLWLSSLWCALHHRQMCGNYNTLPANVSSSLSSARARKYSIVNLIRWITKYETDDARTTSMIYSLERFIGGNILSR